MSVSVRSICAARDVNCERGSGGSVPWRYKLSGHVRQLVVLNLVLCEYTFFVLFYQYVSLFILSDVGFLINRMFTFGSYYISDVPC